MQGPSNIQVIPDIVRVRPPVPDRLFSRRAERFRFLAPGSALGDYLQAMAWLAEAQQAAHAEMHSLSNVKPLPGEYPLHAVEWHRDDSWQLVLKAIISAMEKAPLPAPARAALEHLSACPSLEIDDLADALLAGDYGRIELSSAPFLGAAVQVYWTALAGAIAAGACGQPRAGCPVCASPATAGIVLGDSRLRYLVCGLCSTQWYLPRLTCSNCGSTEGISYLSIENDSTGVKAECCERCRTYLKLFYLEDAPAAEPFADDVATLALDTLISGEGFSRTGLNLYMFPGPASTID